MYLDKITGGLYSASRKKKSKDWRKARFVIGAAQYVPAARAGIDLANCAAEGISAVAFLSYAMRTAEDGECPEEDEEEDY